VIDEQDQDGRERRPDARAAAIGAAQWGQIRLDQLLAAGLTRRQVRRRVEAGRLHPTHRGVFGLGVPASCDEARWMAAVLAADGWLSHAPAAALWSIGRSAGPTAHVTVLRPPPRARRGVVVHRAPDLAPQDRSRHRGIPVTSPARTLLDLATALSPGPLADALTEARVRRLVTDDALRDVLARNAGRPGAGRLRAAVAGPFTRSQLERRLLALLAEHGLPAPRANARVGNDEVDVLLPGLAIELDGRGGHAARWAPDAAKDARLRERGLRTLRLTWWDVVRDGARTAERIRAGGASATG
jgi:very-short-patch-repair endonuclease